MKDNLTNFAMGVCVGLILMGAVWYSGYQADLAEDACKQKGGQVVKGQCYKLEAIK